MSSNELPDHVQRRIMQKGYRRSRGEGPNLTALAEAIGVHTSTLSNALLGGVRHRASAETIRRIVDELGPDTAAWFGYPQARPWEPPAAVALLTDRQRRALEELILSMTEGRDGHGQQPPSIVAEQTVGLTVKPPGPGEVDPPPRGSARASETDER